MTLILFGLAQLSLKKERANSRRGKGIPGRWNNMQNYGDVKKYCWDPVNSIARTRNVLRQCEGGCQGVWMLS